MLALEKQNWENSRLREAGQKASQQLRLQQIQNQQAELELEEARKQGRFLGEQSDSLFQLVVCLRNKLDDPGVDTQISDFLQKLKKQSEQNRIQQSEL